MPIRKTSNFGNPHIGFFAKASDRIAVVGTNASPKLMGTFEELGEGCKTVRTTIGDSGLIGIFIALNSNGAALPSFASQAERSMIRAQGLNVAILPDGFSAAGNNLAVNDFGAIANPNLPREKIRSLSDCLGVEIHQMKVAGFDTVGSCVVATNKGFAAHNKCSEEDIREIESVLKVKGTNCTVNTGVAFVSLGVVANSHGAIFGEECTGFEIGRVMEALSLV